MTIPDAGNTPVPGARLGVEVATENPTLPVVHRTKQFFWLRIVLGAGPAQTTHTSFVLNAVRCCSWLQSEGSG